MPDPVPHEASAALFCEASHLPQWPSRFEPVVEIARGGMGAVWRVIDRQFHRPLAIKVLLPEIARSNDARARFEREAQLTGSLQHPAIPPVADRGTLSDQTPYFSMKLISGHTLEQRLSDRSAPSDGLPRFVAIFEQVCQAVGYAHSQGIVHRDLKPQNIMVGEFGEVQVMDWGMAKQIDEGQPAPSIASPLDASAQESETTAGKKCDDTGAREMSGAELTRDFAPLPQQESADRRLWDVDQLTHAGSVMGTFAYMAPEQARGEVDRVDRRSDVFGLGAILCKILTGQPPYSGEHLWEQARNAALQPALLRLAGARIDGELAGLCLRCLSTDPATRPVDGGAVAKAIESYQQSFQRRIEHEREQRARAEVQAIEERKRRRVLLALACSLLVLFAGGGAVAWSYQRARIAREVEATTKSRQAEEEIRDLLARSAELRDHYDFVTAGILLSQADRRAAVVRDAESLSRLPDNEQKAWRSLWSEVQSLLDRLADHHS